MYTDVIFTQNLKNNISTSKGQVLKKNCGTYFDLQQKKSTLWQLHSIILSRQKMPMNV